MSGWGPCCSLGMVWICVEPGLKAAGIWSLAFNIVYCQHLKCILFFFLSCPSLHNVHSFRWLFKLLDLRRSLKCMAWGICVTYHWENEHELRFLFHMLTFSNIFVKYCFHFQGTLIFEERLDLCSVLQFVQLGKQSCISEDTSVPSGRYGLASVPNVGRFQLLWIHRLQCWQTGLFGSWCHMSHESNCFACKQPVGSWRLQSSWTAATCWNWSL